MKLHQIPTNRIFKIWLTDISEDLWGQLLALIHNSDPIPQGFQKPSTENGHQEIF